MQNRSKLFFKGIALIAAWLILRKIYYKLKYKVNKYPPGSVGIPFYGTLFEFVKSPKKYLYNIGKSGPISMV